MEADREAVINGKRIAEFYWAGDIVVYVDNRLTEKSFEEACEEAKAVQSNAEQ